MTAEDERASKCFNCEGSRSCAVYHHIEGLVWVDAPWYLLEGSDSLDLRACPYCSDEIDTNDHQNWLMWR